MTARKRIRKGLLLRGLAEIELCQRRASNPRSSLQLGLSLEPERVRFKLGSIRSHDPELGVRLGPLGDGARLRWMARVGEQGRNR